MSLLADLLSKVKYEGRKTDVPPDLKRVVSSSAEKEATKKRIIIFSILILFAIVSGVVAVYFMESYIKPSATKKIARTTAPKQIESKPVSPPAEPESKVDVKGGTIEAPKPTAKVDSAASKPRTVKQRPAKESRQQKGSPESQRLYGAEKAFKKEATEEKKIAKEKPPEPTGEDLPRDSQKKAVTAQEPQIKTHDAQKDVYLYTARTYESKKDYHQALSNYKKALDIDPENYIIMNNISSVLIHLGSFEESIKYSKNILNIRKDYVPSLINLGIAYIRLNNLAEGEGYLSRALSIESSNSYALLNLGILYEKRGDHDKAYSYFSKLSDIGNIQGYLGIARILEKQGKASDAVRIYKEIISMNNIDPKIKKLANDRLIQLGQ